MKLNELLVEVKAEIEQEDREVAKDILKERLREIADMKAVLTKAEEQLKELLEKNIESVL